LISEYVKQRITISKSFDKVIVLDGYDSDTWEAKSVVLNHLRRFKEAKKCKAAAQKVKQIKQNVNQESIPKVKQKIYQEIASKIVFSSLEYSQDIDEGNVKLSADAGAEFALLHLHMVDKTAFQMFGATGRNEVFDEISNRVIVDYCKAVVRPNTPESVVLKLALTMQDNMSERHVIYSQCTSSDSWPSRGTLVFALGYYVHLAMQKTSRTDVDEILCGRKDVTEDNIDAFPEMEEELMLSGRVAASLIALQLDKLFRKL
jgi:hypothetical protein